MKKSSNDSHTQANHSSNPIVIRVEGVGPIPSFKNTKRVAGLSHHGGQTWIGNPTLITRPDVKDRKDSITNVIASQLRSMCPTVAGATIQECWKQFVTRSLPRDDCWEDLEIGSVTTQLVTKGLEGCEIIIERVEPRSIHESQISESQNHTK